MQNALSDMGAKSHVLYCGSGNPAPLVTVHLSGSSPDTKKAKVASCPGTRQKPSLDASFWLFWVLKAPGALLDLIQARIVRLLGLQRSRRFRLKRGSSYL